MGNPFNVVKDFETALCGYTGAPRCVTVTSCTEALLLCLSYFHQEYGETTVILPKRTYVGVAHSVINAGHKIAFKDEDWTGLYRLEPFYLWDSARWLSGQMFRMIEPFDSARFVCLSFHWSKHLGCGQGGAILHDGDDRVDEWLRRARFDGRKEGVQPCDDVFDQRAFHCYMSPATAAEGLTRLRLLDKINMPLRNDNYPDLSKHQVFMS